MKSIYMHENWGKVQESKEHGVPHTFIFEKDGLMVKYPFIKRKAGRIDGTEYYDLVTPRGECGPWIEGEGEIDRQELIQSFDEEFSTYCKDENIVAEYIRFSAWNSEASLFEPLYNTKFYGYVFCNDLSVDFFNKEYKSTKRRNVRRAKKEEVEIIFDESPQSIDDFMKMYRFTEIKYDVAPYHKLNRDFIEGYCALLPEETVFAKAMYKGKLISASLLLLSDDIAHYHFGANHPDYRSVQANSLLFYESSLYAQQKGRKYFDLGTARPGSPMEKFKQDMSVGHPSTLATSVRNQDIYNALIEQAGGPRENYFPAYRRDIV